MRTFALLGMLWSSQLFVSAAAFSPRAAATRTTTSTTALTMAADAADDDDKNFMKWARAARYATDEDEVIELPRPLGLVLNQDPAGNVYVETVAPKGNAARTGKVGCCCCCADVARVDLLRPEIDLLSNLS